MKKICLSVLGIMTLGACASVKTKSGGNIAKKSQVERTVASGDKHEDAFNLECLSESNNGATFNIRVENNGIIQDDQVLKKLVHIRTQDTSILETILLNNLVCDMEENGAVCFHNETADKFFIFSDEERAEMSNFILIAMSQNAIDAADSVDLKKADTELGEAYMVEKLSCFRNE